MENQQSVDGNISSSLRWIYGDDYREIYINETLHNTTLHTENPKPNRDKLNLQIHHMHSNYSKFNDKFTLIRLKCFVMAFIS